MYNIFVINNKNKYVIFLWHTLLVIHADYVVIVITFLAPFGSRNLTVNGESRINKKIWPTMGSTEHCKAKFPVIHNRSSGI